MAFRDLYSNLGFYEAFSPYVATDAAGAENGQTLDMKGFNAVLVELKVNSYCSAGANGAGDYIVFALQHGLASALGVSAWSLVPNSQLIHSTVGGYDSTGETGAFLSIMSATDIASSGNSATYTVGYKGDNLHRYLRIKLSNVGAASAANVAATYIVGQPNGWPVQEAINIT
jgi:hypothetical protein